jgi:Cu-Zn family superoxide dismutase
MIVATTFFNHPHIKGVIELEEKGTKVVIKGTLKSNKYKNSTHGIHIHEAGKRITCAVIGYSKKMCV